MGVSAERKREVALATIVGVGGGLFSLHVYHAVLESDKVGQILLGVVFPALFALGVVAGGVRLAQREVEPPHVGRAALWTLAGAGAFVAAGSLTILYQNAEGVVMTDQLFILGNAASGGAIGGFVVGVYDVRQRRQRERSEQLKNRMTVLNRVLRHDIRNRANVLRAQADLLVEDVSPSDEIAETIRKQSTEIATLGNYARDIERIITDDNTDKVVLDVADLIEESVERLCRDYPDAETTVSTPDEFRAHAHPLIASGLSGVLENAVEHNDKETPRVNVTASVTPRDGTDYVEIEVTDNGPGIPDREMAIIERGFETQLEHSEGVGLWLAHWTVTASGGTFDIDTADTEGTRVTLTLKAAPADEPVTPIWDASEDAPAVSAN